MAILVAKRLDLLGVGEAVQVADAVLGVKLDADLVVERGLAAVERAGLDADVGGHNLELGVERRAAGAAEEVLVDLARVALGVVGLGGACISIVSLCLFTARFGHGISFIYVQGKT